jgi:hypothetical protein
MSQPQWTGSPESHPLDGSRSKLARAMHQASYLARHCEAYIQANPFRFRVEWDEATGSHLAFLEGRNPPRYLGLILGEVVHDLRSGLDHTAWQLAIRESGLKTVSEPKVARKIQFPIAPTEQAFRSHPALGYFSQDAVAIMERFQSHHNVGSHLVNPLLVVQRMSNTDKHQVLTASMGQLSLADAAVAASEWISADDIEMLATPNTILDFAKPVMRVKASAEARIQVQEQDVRICFQTDVTGELDFILAERIEPLCIQMADVVEAFAPLFPAVD